MPNTNKRRATNLPDTTPTKQPCPATPPTTLDSQLAQIYSVITAATTLLSTLTTAATNLTLSSPAPPATFPLVPVPTPWTQLPTPEQHPTNQSTTPATLQATIALPAMFGTTPAPMEEALLTLATAPVTNRLTLGPIPATSPPKTHLPNGLTLASLAPRLTTNQHQTHPVNRSIRPATRQATLALPATLGTTPAPMEEAIIDTCDSSCDEPAGPWTYSSDEPTRESSSKPIDPC
jgi:hypothetical protein